MKHFTHEELNPSESTLNIVRQIAHAYRVVRDKNEAVQSCMN